MSTQSVVAANLPIAQLAYERHEESRVEISASPEQIFAVLDDHLRLSSHMNKPSWQMGGGKMETIMDAAHGQSVGSHIVLRGRVFGVELFVEEVVTTHAPPFRKVWETIGEPRLLVIGSYRMSFDITSGNNGASKVRVAIDYTLPEHGVAKVFRLVFGRMYARWCTRQMTTDAAKRFASDAGVA